MQTRGGIGSVRGIRRRFAIHQAGSGKRGSGHLQLAHHDAQDRLQHLFLADSRVHLARGLEQRPQPRHQLLPFDGLATRAKLRVHRHRNSLWNLNVAWRNGPLSTKMRLSSYHSRRTPKRSSCASLLSKSRSSWMAWVANMRSKGSL